MENYRCPACGNLADQPVCPVCGWRQGEANEPHQLQPGTVLRGQYVIGRALGQGGFGITYLGWDRELERKVAVKEFFPSSLVTREAGQTASVRLYANRSRGQYDASRERFLREARALARFSEVPEIVGIYNCFEENGTAYIVMEYVKGSNLAQYVQIRGGKLTVEETLRILKPILATLDRVHQAGLIHRDISPDNIILEPMGGAKLLDFGAVRAVENPEAEKDLTRSTEAIVKHGFAPMEQYRSRGGIGPWTDEYALCATIYYCLTGAVPPDAISRSMGEAQPDWKSIPGLTDRQRAALEKGMSVAARDRYPTVGELSETLFAEKAKSALPPKSKKSVPRTEKPRREPTGKRTGYVWRIAAAAAALTVIVAGVWLLRGSQGSEPGDGERLSGSVSAPAKSDPSPSETPSFLTSPEETPGMKLLRETYVMAPAESLSDISINVRKKQPFWGQTDYPREDVRTVTFHPRLEGAPGNAWDVSEAGNGTILAWMDGSALHVAANGNIAPNPDASWMFAYFTNLEAIDFGGCLDASGITDMSRMFTNCDSLLALDLSGLDTAKVTDMSRMFSRCGSLTALNVSGLDTAGVTNMCYMFYGCDSLTALDLSGFDTAKVTDMEDMFYGCSNLKVLDVSGFHTANVTDMGSMFRYCRSLTALDLSGFDTAKVTDMGDMFFGCSSLTALNLSGFDAANVTSMRNMFYGCGKLTQPTCSDAKILAEYRNR